MKVYFDDGEQILIHLGVYFNDGEQILIHLDWSLFFPFPHAKTTFKPFPNGCLSSSSKFQIFNLQLRFSTYKIWKLCKWQNCSWVRSSSTMPQCCSSNAMAPSFHQSYSKNTTNTIVPNFDLISLKSLSS